AAGPVWYLQPGGHTDEAPVHRYPAGDRGDPPGRLSPDAPGREAPAGLRFEPGSPADGRDADSGSVWPQPLRARAATPARRPVAGSRDHDRGVRLGPRGRGLLTLVSPDEAPLCVTAGPHLI